jgi:hypothetical protein
MRCDEHVTAIYTARRESRSSPHRLVLETKERREFFRFFDEELIEYDLTRLDGREIRISREERYAAESFGSEGRAHRREDDPSATRSRN